MISASWTPGPWLLCHNLSQPFIFVTSLCRNEEMKLLRNWLTATPTKADEQASVPIVLYDGYAVLQEVKRAHAESGRTDTMTLSLVVSDALDAVVKLIKQEQDDE